MTEVLDGAARPPARHDPLWHHFDDLAQQAEANTLGMWAFLATEILIFGGLFTGYAAYQAEYRHAFEAASGRLSVVIAFVNTVVLLASSLTMALAVRAAQLGRRRALVWLLVATAALGAAFLGIKAVEYYQDYEEWLVPGLAFHPEEWREQGINPAHAQLFLVFYYVATGLHAVHLTAGIGIVLVLAWMARRGAFVPEYYAPVEMWGLYWHFVDVVWIFLLPLLYLVGTRPPSAWHF